MSDKELSSKLLEPITTNTYARGHINEMLESKGTFFSENPQEFFASISNQWFSCSFTTFQLALSRYNEGKSEPMNQFMFFADVYSSGQNHTLFFKIDGKGNFEKYTIELSRDRNSFMNSVTIDGRKYSFCIDKDGNVAR